MKNRYTAGIEIEKLIKEAEEIKGSGNIFSDVYDDQGNQYVDLVQEGGGVLGIALVGYTFILEKAGIRFYSLAGTSAGSINTLLMAGVGKPGEATSEKIIDIMGDKNFFDFVDGPAGIKKLIQKKIEKRGSILWNLIVNSWGIWNLLKSRLGINPGEHFEHWLSSSLKKYNVSTYKDLCEKRDQIPNLKHRTRGDFKVNPPKMAIITSDITTHTKVEFPRMGELYWENINELKPSKFVRASMSIPFFFYPYEVKNIPNAGKTADTKWQSHASYEGEVPPAVKFVDGGMLSNFPINTFHVGGIPSRPTFGVRLSTFRQSYSPADGIFNFSGAMISTMRQIQDYEFILKNPDYNKLICKIDADAEFNWLNFGMTPERQKELFTMGARKGLEFLKSFDWEGYKMIRENC